MTGYSESILYVADSGRVCSEQILRVVIMVRRWVGCLSGWNPFAFSVLQLAGIVEAFRIFTWKSRGKGESHFYLLEGEKLRFQPRRVRRNDSTRVI